MYCRVEDQDLSLRTNFEYASSAEMLRRVREEDLRSSTFFKGAATHYDPIFTPIFTAIGFTGTITIGTATITTASLASAIATTAITIGAQLLMAPKPPKAQSGKQPLTQEIPYRVWAVGTCRLAGAMMFWEAKGSKLASVQAMCGHRIHQYRRFWLHDDAITQNSDDTVQPLSDDRYGDGRIRIWSRLGASTETAYSGIVDIFGSEGLWTNNHRGDGQASLGMVCVNPKQKDFNKRFPYNAPKLTAEGDWALVWDWRDPTQSASDDSTWKHTRNSILILAWHIFFNPFGFHRDYQIGLLPVIDMWTEEADICDEDVPITEGGTEKRYECSGWDTTENSPKVGLNQALGTCDGWICERGDGAVLVVAGKFRESRCGVIDEQDITGQQMQYGVLFEDECNRLVAKITYPATDYTTADIDVLEDVAAQVIAGRVLAQEMQLPWVTQWRQGRRLQLREWRRRQMETAGSLDLRPSAINNVYNRWNRISSPNMLPELDGKIVENKRSLLALTKGGFSMDIARHPENIDDLPSGYEGQQPPVPSAPNSAGVSTPVITNIAAISNGGSVYVRVTITDPDDDGLTPVVHWRFEDAGSGSPGTWSDDIQFPDATPAGGSIVLNTGALPTDQTLEFEAAFINGKGNYSEWSPAEDIRTTVDPVMPLVLRSFTITESAPHLGRAPLSLQTDNDAHVRRVQLFRVAAGAPFDPGALAPIATLVVAANGTYSYTDGDPTRANLLSNPNFDADTVWSKSGATWTIAAGVAHHATGAAANLFQSVSLTASTVYRLGYSLPSTTTTTQAIAPYFSGGTTVSGVSRTIAGAYREKMTAVSGNNAFGWTTAANFVGDVDAVALFAETVTCAPQGVWDYYASPFNGSGVIGPSSGPVTVTII
jgi:hypothetical protein